MKSYSLTHLSDQSLLRELAALVSRDRATTASMLAHLAEVDSRKLYLPAGYPSMFAYCVHELRLCEQAAFYRIRAARTAALFPAIFDAVAEGRLHLSAVVLLAPCLTKENADELVAAATHRSKAEIERLLAERFPRPDVPALVRALPTPALLSGTEQLSPGIVNRPLDLEGELERPGTGVPSPAVATQPSPGITRPPKVTPLAPRRFALQITMSQEMHDDLRQAQALLGHRVPSGDVTEVLHRALKVLIAKLEKQKFAATSKPRRSRPSANPGHVPAEVKRSVWKRDGGRCTFVSETGHRCPARQRLEFDHVKELGRGGCSTVSNIRLRCQAHNQYAAECTYGVAFMREKRARAAMQAG